MQVNVTKIRFPMACCTLVAAAGFFPAAQAQVDNMTVQLSLNPSQTTLDPTTRGKCAKNNHNGCIEVPANKKARINFVLTGNKKCNRNNGKTWQLSEVHLGGKNTSHKPGNWGDLDAEIQADFNVANTSTGRLNKDGGSSANQITIFDNNLHRYEVWYKVVAKCVDSGGATIDTIETDPRLRNGGMG